MPRSEIQDIPTEVLEAMEVGDSVVTKRYTMARIANRMLAPKRFAGRYVNEEFRIWRIK